jgi:hypothetical protein
MDELIVKKSGMNYHHTHIYPSSAGGASSRRRQERYMSTQQPKMRKMISKKATQIPLDRRQQQKEEEKEGLFTLMSLDESFLFCDFLVRRVWIEEGKRPIMRVTGS